MCILLFTFSSHVHKYSLIIIVGVHTYIRNSLDYSVVTYQDHPVQYFYLLYDITVSIQNVMCSIILISVAL